MEHAEGVTDPLSDAMRDTVGDQQVGRRLPRALTPFRTPSYRWLALSLTASSFAGGVWVVALVWEVIRLGGGPADLSLVTTAGAVGVLLPALVAGVVADRVPQRVILVGVGLVELAGMSLVALLSAADLDSLWVLAGVAFTTGMAMAFYYPAYSAWLPALVPESDLQAVNGFEGMVRPTIGQAIGPAVAGAVVAASSPGSAFAIAAASSVVTVLALLKVPQTPVRRTLDPEHSSHPVRSAMHDMREGFVYMVRTPWLLATLLFASLMILVMMGPLEVLIPFLVKDELGGGPSDHSYVLAGFGLGGAVGSRLRSLRAHRGDHPGVGGRHVRLRHGRTVLGAHGHLGNPAPATRPAGAARPGRLTGLLRVRVAHAGLHGAGRPGLGGHRPHDHLRGGRHRTTAVRRRRHPVGPPAPGRAGASPRRSSGGVEPAGATDAHANRSTLRDLTERADLDLQGAVVPVDADPHERVVPEVLATHDFARGALAGRQGEQPELLRPKDDDAVSHAGVRRNRLHRHRSERSHRHPTGDRGGQLHALTHEAGDTEARWRPVDGLR